MRDKFFGLVVSDASKDDSPVDLDEARTKAFEQFTDILLECNVISKRHADMYPITNLSKPGAEVLATINRNAAPYLGITSVGVHLLCYVRDDQDDSVSLWLNERPTNPTTHCGGILP